VNPIKKRAYIFHGLMDDDATKKKSWIGYLHHAGACRDGVANKRAPQVHVLRAPAQQHALSTLTIQPWTV
jgi:hypothetical protein